MKTVPTNSSSGRRVIILKIINYTPRQCKQIYRPVKTTTKILSSIENVISELSTRRK